jgi:hypothetical protein
MSRLSTFGASLVLAALLTLILATAAAAQDATPSTDMSPNPEVCTVEARPVEELQAIYGTPHPAGAGEEVSGAEATPVGFVLPVGTPADDATVAAITAAVEQLTACYNAGNYLAGLSLVTDEFLVSQVGLSLFDEDFVATMSASPVALPEEQQTVLLDVRNVIVLEDGRVAALVDYMSPTPQEEGIEGLETDLFIFENVNGVWLLDESVEHLEGTYGPDMMATPAA